MDSKKRPPAWGSAVGILGIIFGAMGLGGGTYELMMPALIDSQDEILGVDDEACGDWKSTKS